MWNQFCELKQFIVSVNIPSSIVNYDKQQQEEDETNTKEKVLLYQLREEYEGVCFRGYLIEDVISFNNPSIKVILNNNMIQYYADLTMECSILEVPELVPFCFKKYDILKSETKCCIIARDTTFKANIEINTQLTKDDHNKLSGDNIMVPFLSERSLNIANSHITFLNGVFEDLSDLVLQYAIEFGEGIDFEPDEECLELLGNLDEEILNLPLANKQTVIENYFGKAPEKDTPIQFNTPISLSYMQHVTATLPQKPAGKATKEPEKQIKQFNAENDTVIVVTCKEFAKKLTFFKQNFLMLCENKIIPIKFGEAPKSEE